MLLTIALTLATIISGISLFISPVVESFFVTFEIDGTRLSINDMLYGQNKSIFRLNFRFLTFQSHSLRIITDIAFQFPCLDMFSCLLLFIKRSEAIRILQSRPRP